MNSTAVRAPADLSLDPKTAMTWSLPITLVLLAVVLTPHAVLYRENALKPLAAALGWWLVPAMVAGIAAHELLHGVTMCVLGRLRWSDMAFGIQWKVLMPFAHPRKPIPALAYGIGAAAPGLVLGLAPAVVGLAMGSGVWSGWGAIFLSAAAGDLIVIYSLWHVPATALVRDHPTRVGCEVVAVGS